MRGPAAPMAYPQALQVLHSAENPHPKPNLLSPHRTRIQQVLNVPSHWELRLQWRLMVYPKSHRAGNCQAAKRS